MGFVFHISIWDRAPQNQKQGKGFALQNLLDPSRVNVQIIAVAIGKAVESSFGFGWNLYLAVVKPLMEARLKVGGLTTNLRRFIYAMLRKQVCKSATMSATPTKSRKRCAWCVYS